jgi:hypothetical protein
MDQTQSILTGVGIIGTLATLSLYKIPIGPFGLLILAVIPWTGTYGINLAAAGTFIAALVKIIVHVACLILSKYLYIFGPLLFPEITSILVLFSYLIYINPFYVFDIIIASSPRFMSGTGHFRYPIVFPGMKHSIGEESSKGGINVFVFCAIIAAISYGGVNILDMLPEGLSTPIRDTIKNVLNWTGFTALLGGGGVGAATFWTSLQTGDFGTIKGLLPSWLGGKEGQGQGQGQEQKQEQEQEQKISPSGSTTSQVDDVENKSYDAAADPTADDYTLTSSEINNVKNEAYAQALIMYKNETVDKEKPTPILNNYVPSQDTLIAIETGVTQNIKVNDQYDSTGKVIGSIGTTTDNPAIRKLIKLRLPYVLEGFSNAKMQYPEMANSVSIQSYLSYVNQAVKVLNAAAAVGVASGAVLSGGGYKAVGRFVHSVLNVPPVPSLSSILNSLDEDPHTARNKQTGGGKQSSTDDSIFLGLLAVITLGGMASAVLRSLPNRTTH